MQSCLFDGAPTDLVNPSDIWITPDWIAQDIIRFFNPQGVCLDPCRGDGAFFRYLPANSLWCEIRDGRDFFQFSAQVDWCLSNPPFSLYSRFMAHAMAVSNNIVWFLPVNKIFGSHERIESLRNWGWVKHIRTYGKSRSFGLDVGYVCAAVHFQRHYHGDTSWSFF